MVDGYAGATSFLGFYEVLNTFYKSIKTFQLNEYLFGVRSLSKLIYLQNCSLRLRHCRYKFLLRVMYYSILF